MAYLRCSPHTRSEQGYNGKWIGINFLFLILLLILLLCPAQVLAKGQKPINFDISSTSLSQAVIEFGRQSDTPIAILGDTPPLIRTPAVRGTMAPDAALRLLLEGSGYRFHSKGKRGYIIERQRVKLPKVTHPAMARAPAMKSPKIRVSRNRAISDADIIVTATKSDTPLSQYAGSIYLAPLDDPRPRSNAGYGSETLVDNFPVLSATALGAGRNKLFGRNISDSSLSGWAQNGLAVYWGEQRLTYTAPDPNLLMLDMQRAEVMMGPYGTLYGAGAIGGIVRLMPQRPDSSQLSASVKKEVNFVRKGGVGGLISGMANVPILEDKLALRALAYHNVDAGYIDNPVVNRKNVNRQETNGGRLMLRWEPQEDWTIDAALLRQSVRAVAPPYAENWEYDVSRPNLQLIIHPLNPLVSYKFELQPYDSDYNLANLTVEKRFGDIKLISSTGWSLQKSYEEVAIGSVSANRFWRDFTLWTHETRLTGRAWDTSFTLGLSVADSSVDQRAILTFRPPPGAGPVIGISVYTNHIAGKTREYSAFAEVERELASGLRLRLGGRLGNVSEWRFLESKGLTYPASTSKQKWTFTPSASLAWQPSREHLFFAAFRQGFRSAGDQPEIKQIRPELGGGETDTVNIADDRLTLIEAGYRLTLGRDLRLSANIFHTRWENIQREMADRLFFGVVVDAAAGTQFWGGDFSAEWRPTDRLSLDGSLSLSQAALHQRKFTVQPYQFMIPLPMTTKLNGRLAARYEWPLRSDARLHVGAAVRHYGKTSSDVGLIVPAYQDIGMEAQLRWDRYKLGVQVSNLLDTRDNRYAFGNPYEQTTIVRDSLTVQQPRTIYLSASADF